jgi:tetratricopeptide (TPR) repeat protein
MPARDDLPRLGSFDLESPIARGGHGEVWRARHRGSGQKVAVKVLRGEAASAPGAVAALREEVRSIAALDHPRVVQLLGLGDAGEGRPAGVVEGAPWFAMELATGTLAQGVDTFEELVAALEQVLAALAHAHARGLLHLDLKPANVLLGCVGADDEVELGRVAGLRLSDFGIARRWRASTGSGSPQGTPAYMAPEQLRDEARRFGPWTDLYALGHVAWHLATGRRALSGSLTEVIRQQLAGVTPEFTPRFPVPARLVSWLRWCLARAPHERPQSAAEAWWGLRDLTGDAHTLDTVTLGDPDPSGAATWVPDDPLPAAAPTPQSMEVVTWTPPPMREPPRRAEAWGRLRWLPDAGLDVLALKPARLMGRDEELAALWTAAREASEGRPWLVLLDGPPGSGRRQLVSALSERLCEAGVASILRLRADDDGPGPALRRWCQATDLTENRLRERLEEALRGAGEAEDWRIDGLAAWLDGRLSPAPPALATLLGGAWTRRALLVVVEGASTDAAAWVGALLDAAGPLRVLVVWVEPGAGAAAFGDHPRATTMTLSPLSPHAMEGLLRAWFGLARSLADEIGAAAGGLPEVAAQAVHHLRARGQLRPGSGGLERSGVGPIGEARPDALWLARLEAAADEPLVRALEAAAVDRRGWTPLEPLRLEPLLAANLVQRGAEGWSFVGAHAAAALRERARAGGRLRRLHADAAAAEEEPHARGAHWLAAGEPDRAAEAFLASAWARHAAGAFRASALSAEQAAAALQQAGAPPADPRWAAARLASLEASAGRGLVAEVRAAVPTLLDDARRFGWADAETRSIELRGWLAHLQHQNAEAQLDAVEAARRWAAQGRLAEQGRALTFEGLYRLASGDAAGALDRLDRVLPLLEGCGEARSSLVTARVARANALQRLGRHDDALGELRAAYAASEGDATTRSRVCRQLTATLLQAERPGEALAYVQESARLARQGGALVALTHTLNLQGEVLRQTGRLADAAAAYLEAVDLAQRQGDAAFHPSLNLALTLLSMGEDDAALARAEALEPGDHRLEALVLRLVVLVAHARRGRWMSARGLARDLLPAFRAVGARDRDLIVLVELGLAVDDLDPSVRAALQDVRDAW